MNRQDVLRGNRHRQQQRNHQPLEQTGAFGVLLVDHRQGLVRQCVGQTGFGYRHGKGTQQGIGQRHCRPAAQALIESRQRPLNTEAAKQATGQGANDQSHYHVYTAQAKDQHDPHCRNDCVHRFTPAI